MIRMMCRLEPARGRDLVPSSGEIPCFSGGTELSPADASPLVAKAVALFGGRARLLSDDEFRSLGFRSRAERAVGLTPAVKWEAHPIPTSATTKEGIDE